MRARHLLRHGALLLAVAAIAACTSPPKPAASPGDSATVNGWVTTGTFQ